MNDDTELAGATSVSPSPSSSGLEPADALMIRLLPEHAVVPADCACCGGVASRTVRESRMFDRGSLFVPYCGACHGHVSEGATHRLAVGVSSLLVAFTLALGLPLSWQPPGPFSYAAIVAFGTMIPAGFAWARSRTSVTSHVVRGRAVWFRFDGSLICSSADWGSRLARASGAESVLLRAREPVVPYWSSLGALGAIVLTPFLYDYHFPILRIVDVAERRVTVSVDDVVRADIEATSSESARAGVSVRIAAGTHTLSARGPDDRVVDTTTVRVESGVPYLYAPASDGTCFWLETTGYGKLHGFGTERVPLGSGSHVWAVPGVDVWFGPAPPESADNRSTGGRIRALRQARCDTAPEEVRGAL